MGGFSIQAIGGDLKDTGVKGPALTNAVLGLKPSEGEPGTNGRGTPSSP